MSTVSSKSGPMALQISTAVWTQRRNGEETTLQPDDPDARFFA
eukprot:CAMPEP_0170601686 /NCGR_PEP_ID=MMETSP0224-20130122/17992_1 /TAXON_ID=285029 /ORGANISM="Togula jolla, Strain CCCM 725" /LENGTH=42 /DNA_ID= /DNA_START= /DNA_END= /DNA_ORIENTATION=